MSFEVTTIKVKFTNIIVHSKSLIYVINFLGIYNLAIILTIVDKICKFYSFTLIPAKYYPATAYHLS